MQEVLDAVKSMQEQLSTSNAFKTDEHPTITKIETLLENNEFIFTDEMENALVQNVPLNLIQLNDDYYIICIFILNAHILPSIHISLSNILNTAPPPGIIKKS